MAGKWYTRPSKASRTDYLTKGQAVVQDREISATDQGFPSPSPSIRQ